MCRALAKKAEYLSTPKGQEFTKMMIDDGKLQAE
jgi:hypothetical protein